MSQDRPDPRPLVPSPGLPITVAVLAVSSMTVLANATVAPALPGLARAFASTPGIETLAGLVVSLPSLAVICTAALFGWAADRYDRSALLLVALLAYALGGASGLVAETMPLILAGRLLLGIGVAGTLTIATQIAADLWHGADRARFMGWQGAAISASGILSLLAAGALAEVHWRAPFGVYLLALPVAVLAWMALPRRARGQSNTPQSKDTVPFPWAVLALTGGILFLAMVFILLAATRLPFLLNELGVTSASVIGATLALMTVASFPGGFFYGRIRARFAPPVIAVVSLAVMGLGYALISQAETLPLVVAGVLTTGAGLGAIIPNQNVWLMAHVPDTARGRSSGMMTTLLFAGQFASPFVSAAVLAVTDLSGVFLVFALGAGMVAAMLGASHIVTRSRAAGSH
ncbi:MFS transporter [Pseudaestuariivita sp.]|uniref:MFS transporter n=1 Tax=Pseudaestuariivita sp. TaxID=2211669 RepID=UPI004059FEB8